MKADGTGYLARRSMACETTLEARRAGVIFARLQIVLRSLLWLALLTPLWIRPLLRHAPEPRFVRARTADAGD